MPTNQHHKFQYSLISRRKRKWERGETTTFDYWDLAIKITYIRPLHGGFYIKLGQLGTANMEHLLVKKRGTLLTQMMI